MHKEISGNSAYFSFNEYNSGESFCIMYKKVKNDELLKLISKDNIIYLSNYLNGAELEYQFEEYIYNDTENNITINIKDTAFGVETSDSVTIGKGEIYGFDWTIDSATISYSEDSNNERNDNQEQIGNIEDESGNEEQNGKKEEDNTATTEPTKRDNTQATEKLPQTGKNMTIIYIIIIAGIITVISYKKYYKFMDIK